jgi:hypothetical protein
MLFSRFGFADEDGVAVGCRARDRAGRNRAVCPGLVVDHHRLLEGSAQLIRDDTRGWIDAAADRERHHERDGPARIILRKRAAGDQHGSGNGRDTAQQLAAPGQRGQAYCRIFR